MAGHSKWHNIKHRKSGQDAKRAKVFTRIIRELTVAARDGGGNIDDNPGLRVIVEKAKAAQMPRDTMDRAIARGAGGREGGNLETLTYEGYGPGGVAILVEAMTDNRNRTVSEVRHVFARAGGNLGTFGSVSYMFDKRGLISLAAGADEDEVMEIAINVGALDVNVDDLGNVEIVTEPEDCMKIRDTLAGQGIEPISSEVLMAPQNYIDMNVEMAEKVMRLLELLEDLDDVTSVYTNANFPGEMMEN
ncbi:MAG: YebC/PmpR family DNA-binding transcriptional regulator [Gammaproteobacteria bacterium]|nr:YebC/PmpR family DNA-binding transcriptional regulator [Gammaproteobacteria bacterium]